MVSHDSHMTYLLVGVAEKAANETELTQYISTNSTI